MILLIFNNNGRLAVATSMLVMINGIPTPNAYRTNVKRPPKTPPSNIPIRITEKKTGAVQPAAPNPYAIPKIKKPIIPLLLEPLNFKKEEGKLNPHPSTR